MFNVVLELVHTLFSYACKYGILQWTRSVKQMKLYFRFYTLAFFDSFAHYQLSVNQLHEKTTITSHFWRFLGGYGLHGEAEISLFTFHIYCLFFLSCSIMLFIHCTQNINLCVFLWVECSVSFGTQPRQGCRNATFALQLQLKCWMMYKYFNHSNNSDQVFLYPSTF